MKKTIQLKVFPSKVNNLEFIKSLACKQEGINKHELTDIVIVKRSLDARSSRPFFLLRIDLYIDQNIPEQKEITSQFRDVSDAAEVLVIGAGPAGYFAALELIELGLRPIIIDRGKDVRERRRDLKAIQQEGVVNGDSNYCFGEGGAGTYSDGKLYTRSHKRGKIEKVLRLLVEHGAISDIMIDAHPHIGSNKLPKIISAIRETIESHGGVVRFNSKVVDFILKDNHLKGVKLDGGETIKGSAVILATGHSARDIYKLLDGLDITIEAKPFALGLRIEHPQSIIDKIQYNQTERSPYLPAASYSMACQVERKGVFSFCMCPGGLVVPAATSPGEIVVNGMSLSRRDSAFANSGIVTAIELDELENMGYAGVFASLDFQRDVETKMFNAGDGSQKAPAQRMIDFTEAKLSDTLNSTSYIPGLYSAPLHDLLPSSIYYRLSEGLKQFGKKNTSYFTNDANVIGVESRTSAPVKIPRDKETFMHIGTPALFPCGEGAGYAGGILSAAMDGQNVAKAVRKFINS